MLYQLPPPCYPFIFPFSLPLSLTPYLPTYAYLPMFILPACTSIPMSTYLHQYSISTNLPMATYQCILTYHHLPIYMIIPTYFNIPTSHQKPSYVNLHDALHESRQQCYSAIVKLEDYGRRNVLLYRIRLN